MGTIQKITHLVWICCWLLAFCEAQQKTEEEMKTILATYDEESSKLCNKNAKANWDVQTDVNNQEKVRIQNEVNLEYAKFRLDQYNANFKDVVTTGYTDPDVLRKLSLLKEVGTAVLDDTDLTSLNGARNRMSSVYNNAKICPFNKPNCDLSSIDVMTLDPHIEDRLAASEDFDEMKWIWEQWHDKSGKLMREDYKKYVELMNKAAKENKYDNAGEMWRSRYEDKELIKKVDDIWKQVEPLYDELHKYVRNELKYLYGSKMDSEDENIPAHLLGNMWAQSWVNLYDRIKPFKNASLVDVTASMVSKNYNAKKMFEMSDDFYKSLGLPSSAMSYSDKAVIEKPEQIIACHASAWDFCDGEDFRIKMCTKVNNEDFVTVHHEMGHIMYYLLYKQHPLLYRTGANPGFHEAVGDTIALSVSTPQHLKTVGLLDNYADSREDNINALFHMALERVAFLPFGLLIDKWRWDVFSGDVAEDKWNEHWWKLREQYQKVSPPSTRGEEFFDPGAKYHVPADSQYIAYFVAHILEFSFYKSLCVEADQYVPNDPNKPLHKCDFYNSKKAGDKLRAGLELGYSKHWGVALKELTGSEEMTADAILEYFKPLQDFLKEQNDISDKMDKYNEEAAVIYNKMVKAEWAVATDTENSEKKTEHEKVVLESAEFSRKYYDDLFSKMAPTDVTNELNKRQLKYLTKLGRDKLTNEKLSQLTQTINKMEEVYNTATICPFDKKDCDLKSKDALTLDPDITKVMAESENYEELKWAWEQWREKSGKLMKDDYNTYVSLTNEAAKLNDYSDYGAYWRDSYEDENFVKNVDEMWKQVEPLYSELHTFVRRKLQKKYPNEMKKDSETIPAHLLGNMWAQSWNNLYDRTKPFSNGSLIDIDEKLKTSYTVLQMFEESDRFFKGLGLESNGMSYDVTKGAVIEKPTQVITCHASAWDFYDREDFRIKMCTSINQEDFITVHHEMGHIQYFILYKHLPVVLRTGANPGFHEAVGDLIALSVSTPTHLKKINLLDNYADSKEDNINALFKMALERVAFLPFGLLIDKWRWDVFSGEVKEDKWNEHWWELREKYQKVSPPSARGAEFFDPGAKYHIPADSQYMAYFIAHILEFQMHRAVCIEAGQYDPADPNKPLHKCDIDNSKEAGKKIRAGLELGLSKHWSEALKEMTGETKIDGSAVVEYFKPLYDFLKEENAKDGVGHLIPGFLTIVIAVIVSIMSN